jgi:hypothetical protein
MTALFAQSQKPGLRVTLEGIGDNREFSGGISYSQTILGTRGSFEASFSIDGHHLVAGLSHLYEFGSKPGYHQPAMILYYQYEDPVKSFHFGSFPRKNLANFPLALMADTIDYYRPNIEGMRGELNWGYGYQNMFVDWTGRQTDKVRESFTAATSGEISLSGFYIRNYVLLNHLAHSSPRGEGEHVNDNLGYAILAGWKTSDTDGLHGYLNAGVLGSVYRERSVSDGFQHAVGLLAEGFLRHRNFAMKNTLHTGEGHTILTGDPFFRQRNYNRTDAIWYFINHRNVSGRFNLSFHLSEWKNPDHSQQISIVYRLP